MQNIKEPPFIATNQIINLVAEICEILMTIRLNDENKLTPILRKENRIKTIRASLAIENNSLSLEQVTAIIEDKKVIGNEKEIKEVKNAYEVYEKITSFNALSIKDLLKAHEIMMKDLIQTNGVFRTSKVGVFDKSGLVHLAPPAKLVPQQIENLFLWYKDSKMHPLIKSSIFHYEFEFIHPFFDGNGRLGRMWQSKLLGEWNENFYFLPVEELIIKTQKQYYNALSQSDESGNSQVFVEYMLNLIKNAVYELSIAQKTLENLNKNGYKDDFNASDEIIKKDESKKNTIPIAVSLTKTSKDKLKSIIKGICNIKEFMENELTKDNEFFSDELIMMIFYQASLENISIRDFIKKKLKFINYAPPATKEEKILQSYFLDKNKKQEIEKRAKKLNKSISFYSSAKLAVLIEMQNLFNKDELQIIMSEAKNENKSVQEYLAEFF